MGRTTRHQKFVKSEKSKIKLKGKKELPKGTNVTNTAFKVKKIVIREQLKEREGVGGRAGVRELLSRLGHFNAGARGDALGGLRELLQGGGGGGAPAQLGDMLMAVCPLALDKEKNVRRESLKVLQQLLVLCGQPALVPFSAALSGFLRCAMTHLHRGVREDSLLLLEVLLLHAPSCLSPPAQQTALLPAFLDMVSRLRADSRPGRTLTLNMSGQQSAVRWRTSVLTGLMKFLELLVGVKERPSLPPSSLAPHVYSWKNSRFPLRARLSPGQVDLSVSRTGPSPTDTEEEPTLAHVEALAPLLWESWSEVRPAAGAPLSPEAHSTLSCIMKIVAALLRHKKTCERFSDCHGVDFAKLFVGGIPYHAMSTSRKKKGSPKDENIDQNCFAENLAVCSTYLALGREDAETLQHIIQYLERNISLVSIDSCRSSLSACVHVLLALPSCRAQLQRLLLRLVEQYAAAEASLSTRLCVLSCLSGCSLQGAQGWEERWAQALLDSVSLPGPLPTPLLAALLALSVQRPALMERSLRGRLPALVQRLPVGEAAELPVDSLLALLYRVPRWDNDSLDILQERLACCTSLQTKQHLVEVLRLRTEGLFCG